MQRTSEQEAHDARDEESSPNGFAPTPALLPLSGHFRRVTSLYFGTQSRHSFFFRFALFYIINILSSNSQISITIISHLTVIRFRIEFKQLL